MVDFQGCVVLFLTCLLSTILLRAILTKYRARARPPGPMSLPIIGHLHLLAPIPHQALYKLSKRYGPLMHINFGSVPVVVVSSPEMAKECLKTNETCFSDRPKVTVIEYLACGSTDFVFAPYGTYWKFMKKLCMSELFGAQTLEQFRHVRKEEISWFLQSLLRKANANEVVNVGRQLTWLTNNVISRMAMSRRCSEDEAEADELRKLVQEMTKLTGKLNLSDFIWFCKNLDLQGFGPRLKELRKKFRVLTDTIIREHKEASKTKTGIASGVKQKDLVDILLEISEDKDAEVQLTIEDIKVFLQDIFTAGTDTSAITIEWAIAELINNPNVMEKARQEIDSVIGKTRIVEESDIPNLPYLQAIVKETLRLHPSVPLITREATKHCTVANYEIPIKTQLYINVWAIGKDSNYWENALQFYPERFIQYSEGGGKSELDIKGQHFQLLPFGTGRRRCPGTSLALHIVQTSLAAVIQCFDWKITEASGKLNMEEGPGMTAPRAHPLMCTPVARLNPFPSF